MPLKAPRRHHRGAPKHKHTQNYLQTYWPYLPMIAILVVGLLFGGASPIDKRRPGTLAYATEMSASGLLSATNSERNANGRGSLTLNSRLTSAAQAKANDMVTRNYWSHDTPDGQKPWVFIQNAGYTYTKAGENLAYGFMSSSDTVIGWMNSASHKANLLDSAFTEVGFGITNGASYNNSGPQTVVVAMYGQPQVLASTNTAPSSTAPSTSTPKSTSTTKKATPAPQPVATTIQPTVQNTPKTETKPEATPQSSNAPEAEITRAHILTRGKTPWIVTGLSLLTGLSAIILLVRHGFRLRKLLKKGERFILLHPVFDTILVSLIMLGYILSSTTGFIK